MCEQPGSRPLTPAPGAFFEIELAGERVRVKALSATMSKTGVAVRLGLLLDDSLD